MPGHTPSLDLPRPRTLLSSLSSWKEEPRSVCPSKRQPRPGLSRGARGAGSCSLEGIVGGSSQEFAEKGEGPGNTRSPEPFRLPAPLMPDSPFSPLATSRHGHSASAPGLGLVSQFLEKKWQLQCVAVICPEAGPSQRWDSRL